MIPEVLVIAALLVGFALALTAIMVLVIAAAVCIATEPERYREPSP